MSHYLDYAATSAVRPPEVIRAVTGFLEECGASPGRGGHGRAVEASRIAFRARRALVRLLGGVGDPGRVTFSFHATHALNTALSGLLRPGDVAVTTAFDHNAVLRPLHALSRTRGVTVRMLPGTPEGEIDPAEARSLLRGARLLVLNHASNVLGTVLPVPELASMAHEEGALVVLDAAQSIGHIPVDASAIGADLIAFTGHKGLLGPQGTGGLWIRPGIDFDPLLQGGTGGDSEDREMPEVLPDRFEAGTANGPGIAGLLAGATWLLERGIGTVQAHEAALKERLREGLRSIRGVRVLSPPAPSGTALVTLRTDRVDPSTLMARLDREFGVEARAGLHCAPEAHRVLGTLGTGALRLSLGWASTEEDVDRAIEGIHAIAGEPAFALGG